jgi:hypothetical protein
MAVISLVITSASLSFLQFSLGGTGDKDGIANKEMPRKIIY